MHIYLIRHGESTSDIEDRYGGYYDDHLTSRGRSQAQTLAKQLASKKIEIIYSSPFFRAKETAEILKDCLQSKLQIVQDIRERNRYGILTGMIKSEAKKEFPDQVALLKDTYTTLKNGESYQQFKRRVLSAFEQITEHPVSAVAIITHAGPIRCFFREVLKRGELKNIPDCAVFALEKKGSAYTLVTVENIR